MSGGVISHSCRVRDRVSSGVISHCSSRVRGRKSGGVISHRCSVRGGVNGSVINYSSVHQEVE